MTVPSPDRQSITRRALERVTAGVSGATKIGVSAISRVAGANAQTVLESIASQLFTHVDRVDNPHATTPSQVGSPPNSRRVDTSSPLTGGGDLAADRTLAVNDASAAGKGVSRASVAPASATDPVFVGDNDGRVPTQGENDALQGTTGTPSNANRYVTNDDARNTNTRTPTDGTVTDAKVAANAAIAETKLSLASDALPATPSRRTLGTGAQQAAAGNDTRLSDSRTPTAHASSHQPGGTDAMAVDAVPATGSLRSLGTGVQQAAAGNRGLIPGGTGGQVLAKNSTTDYDVAWVAQSGGTGGGFTPTTHIEGLVIWWNSASSLSVDDGSVYIPGPNRVVENPVTLTLSGLTFAANTWYYIYGFADASGNLALDPPSTVPPAAPYRGDARIKGGATPDNTRRYLGAVRSNGVATPGMYSFVRNGPFVYYRENSAVTPFRVLSAGVATTQTDISCANVIPLTSSLGIANYSNFSSQFAYFAAPDTNLGTMSASNTEGVFSPNTYSARGMLRLNGSQIFRYLMGGAVSGAGAGLYIEVQGYLEER